MTDEVKTVEAEVVEDHPPFPGLREQDIVDAFQQIYDQLVLQRAAIAECLRQLSELRGEEEEEEHGEQS